MAKHETNMHLHVPLSFKPLYRLWHGFLWANVHDFE